MKLHFLLFSVVFALAFVVIGFWQNDLKKNRDVSVSSDRSAEFPPNRLDSVESNLGKRDHSDIIIGELSSQENLSRKIKGEIREDLTSKIFHFMVVDEDGVFSDRIKGFPDILDLLLKRYGDEFFSVVVEMLDEMYAGAEGGSAMHSRISELQKLIGQALARAISNGWIKDEVKMFGDVLPENSPSYKSSFQIIYQTYYAIERSRDKKLISKVFLNICNGDTKQGVHFSELARTAGAFLGHEYALSMIPVDGRLGDSGARMAIGAIIEYWLATDPIEASQFIKDAPDSAHRMIYIEEMVSYLARSGSIEEAKGWLEVLPEGSLNYLNANEAINESMEREKSKTQEIPEEQ